MSDYLRPARHIGFFLYDGMAASDILWEVDMFRLAPVIAAAEDLACPSFETLMIGLAPGPVNTWADFRIHADYGLSRLPEQLDMLYIGSALPDKQAALLEKSAFTSGIAALAATGCRIVAVGSAAMMLAELGLLDGRRATVHSVATEAFRLRFPNVFLDPDPLWVEDGPIVTTAGSLPGVEFTLEVLERECGRAMSFAIAKAGLLPMRRGASQGRLSATLLMQIEASDRFDAMLQWITENLHAPMSVPDLADLAGMSLRNFARRFVERTGKTPARFIEGLRADRARQLLETTRLPLLRVAEQSGLRDEQGLRRALLKIFGLRPSDIQKMAERSNLAESD